jgi:hypothetical protein
MVSIAELLDWQPSTLGTVADALVRSRKQLVDLQDEVDDATPPWSWAGGAGDRARTAHERLRLRLLDMAAEVSDVAVNLDDADGRLAGAKRSLEDALTAARTQGFTVDHVTGTVTDPQTYDDEGLAAHAHRRVREIADDISAALTAADRADADLASALRAAARGRVDGGTGSLADAVVQLPTSMDDLSQAELVALLGGDIAVSTISAFVSADVEVASFDLEGRAEGKYVVMADGTVKMSLALEAGLGRGISVNGTEAEVSAGGTTELELAFDSVDDAEAFLAGLDDATLEFDGLGDYLSPTTTVIDNVADYVMEQDISSFKTGVYGKGVVAIESPILDGAAEGRIDAYYDWAAEQYGVKVTAGVEGDLGSSDSGYAARAQLTGEVKLNNEGAFDELSLKGEMQGSLLNERLGVDIPGSRTGQGFDVELKVTSDNPAREQIEAAVGRGDLDEAVGLALDNGRVVVRQTTVETIEHEEHGVDLGFAQGDIEYGATAETANQIWVRRPGTDNLVPLDPTVVAANTGS